MRVRSTRSLNRMLSLDLTEFCLILLLACRIKWSDARQSHGQPHYWQSWQMNKPHRNKNQVFLQREHFTWIEGHRFSKRGIWESESENEVWGSGAVSALSLISPDGWLIISGKCCGNSQMVFEFKLTGTIAWISNLICFLYLGSWTWPLK